MQARLQPGLAAALVATLAAGLAWADVSLDIEPDRATIGDPVSVRLTIETAEENPPEREKLGPELGPFTVLSEQWSGRAAEDGRHVWTWTATIATYETKPVERLAVMPSGAEAEMLEQLEALGYFEGLWGHRSRLYQSG